MSKPILSLIHRHINSKQVALSLIKHFSRELVSLELKDKRTFKPSELRRLSDLRDTIKTLEGD
jgi:hypothetical protein